MKIGNPFSSLKQKNFRYYWLGMCVSTTGTWMQNIAQPWLAYKLTDSPFLLSLVSAMQFMPILLFSLFAGVLVDRIPKKKILLFTQSASLLTALAIALLIWTKQIQYWHLLVSSTVLGLINTLDMPTRQSFLIELVPKEDLMNAIALNSAVFNLSRTIGPALAGLVMTYWGIANCFFINAISFGAVLISLFFIKPMKIERPEKKDVKILKNIGDGLKYIYKDKLLYVTILITAVVGTFAMNFNVLVPVFAVNVLHQQENGYGLLMSCMGLGSFLGAMLVAVLSKAGPKKFILYAVPIFVALALVITGFTGIYALTGIALAVAGFFFIMFTSTANSAMQMNTDSEHLGRVMSVYTLVFAGSTPIGNLYAGAISEKLGAGMGFILCGGIILVLMIPIYLYILRQRRINPGKL
jgi:MFS family permease